MDKKTELGARIRILRQALGLTQASFGLGVEIAKTTVTRYEQGEFSPNSAFLDKLHEVYGVNLNWLVSGDGDVFSNGVITNNEPARINYISPRLPILGSACAGQNGFLVNGNADYYIEWPPGIRDPKAFGFEVRGDSMVPVYKDGDVVICSREARPHPDCDAVVAIGEDCYCKIWRPMHDGKIELACYNRQTYDSMQVPRSAIHDVAKVVGLIWRSQAQDMRVDGPAIQSPAKLQLKK